ncbi:hypothetical protein Bca101_059076 [Brassica carinata]
MGEEDERDPKHDSSPLNKAWNSASYGVTSYKALVQPNPTSSRKAQSTSAAAKKQSRTENQWGLTSTTKPRPAVGQRHAYCPNPRKSLSTSKKPEEVEKTSPAKHQGWISTTSKCHYQATSRKEVFISKPESAYMDMSAHDLKPKKVTSSVLTPQKGAMRSSQTEKVQERPIPTLLMGSQGLQEVCQSCALPPLASSILSTALRQLVCTTLVRFLRAVLPPLVNRTCGFTQLGVLFYFPAMLLYLYPVSGLD